VRTSSARPLSTIISGAPGRRYGARDPERRAGFAWVRSRPGAASSRVAAGRLSSVPSVVSVFRLSAGLSTAGLVARSREGKPPGERACTETSPRPLARARAEVLPSRGARFCRTVQARSAGASPRRGEKSGLEPAKRHCGGFLRLLRDRDGEGLGPSGVRRQG
jgi:hypothetical protein